MEMGRFNSCETVLVTGASGFIGSHLCHHLVEQGLRVVGSTRQSPERLPAGVKPHVGNLADPDEAAALIAREKPDTIFHLASHVTGNRDASRVRPTFEANLASTVYLMSAAVCKGGCRRFVLAGSLEEPDTVDIPPSSPYAAAKAAATAYAQMFHALYAFPVVVARIFMVYGPDQKDENKLVPYVINSLLTGETPRMGSGMRPVDWIYVEDVVAGLVRLALTDGLAGQTIDIGSGQMETVRNVVERIARLTGSAVPLHFDPAADRPFERVRAADITQTQTLTGWQPLISLEDGLRRTIAWHRKQVSAPTLS